MTLACRHYLDSGWMKHASRCGQAALHIYEHKGWSYIEENLKFILGRFALETEEFSKAFDLFQSMICGGKCRPNQVTQRGYLSLLIKAYNGLPISEDVKYLKDCGIPEFLTHTLRFHSNMDLEHREKHKVIREEEWNDLEEGLIKGGLLKPRRQNDRRATLSFAVNELIVISIELVNNLSTAIILRDVELEFTQISKENAFLSHDFETHNDSVIYEKFAVSRIPEVILNPAEKKNVCGDKFCLAN